MEVDRNDRTMRFLKYGLATLILISAALAVLEPRTPTHERTLYQDFENLPEILNLIQRAYVDPVDVDKLMPGAFQGVLSAADPNASFVASDSRHQGLREILWRQTGLVVIRRANAVYVLAVLPGSPAQQAGLAAGDRIRQIHGTSTRNWNLQRTLAELTQPVPSTHLFLEPEDGADPRSVILVKGMESRTPISWEALDGEAWTLQLPCFYEGFDRALASFLTQNEPQRLVLDLRANAWGKESHCRALCELLLPSMGFGSIQTARGTSHAWRVERRAFAPPEQLFILVNESTAAAAEQFAALAQYHGLAQLLGERTLGLPWMYEQIPLRHGGFVELATRKFLFPNQKSYQGVGLIPDVPLDAHEDSVRPQLIELLHQRKQATPKKAA